MLKKIRTQQNQKGFTLIELMVVIAIIGILAAIAIPQFAAYRNRSYMSELEKYSHTYANAQEAYFVDNDTYTAASLVDIATYGVPTLKAYMNLRNQVATSASFSFDVVDIIHAIQPQSFVTYISSAGGIQ